MAYERRNLVSFEFEKPKEVSMGVVSEPVPSLGWGGADFSSFRANKLDFSIGQSTDASDPRDRLLYAFENTDHGARGRSWGYPVDVLESVKAFVYDIQPDEIDLRSEMLPDEVAELQREHFEVANGAGGLVVCEAVLTTFVPDVRGIHTGATLLVGFSPEPRS